VTYIVSVRAKRLTASTESYVCADCPVLSAVTMYVETVAKVSSSGLIPTYRSSNKASSFFEIREGFRKA
jgi:hypothetical protein